MSSGTFEGKFVIDKLTGSNCGVWSVKLKMILMKSDLWRLLIGGTEVAPTEATEAYTRRFVKATATVGLTVDGSFSLVICDQGDARLVDIQEHFRSVSCCKRTFLTEEVLSDMPLCQMVAIDTRHQRQFGWCARYQMQRFWTSMHCWFRSRSSLKICHIHLKITTILSGQYYNLVGVLKHV